LRNLVIKDFSENLKFKSKLFYDVYSIYFSRTPESDSLYRRRNRLIVLGISSLFYYQTSKEIFSRIEIEILIKGSFVRKLVKFF